jgi:hypothetical protein
MKVCIQTETSRREYRNRLKSIQRLKGKTQEQIEAVANARSGTEPPKDMASLDGSKLLGLLRENLHFLQKEERQITQIIGGEAS